MPVYHNPSEVYNHGLIQWKHYLLRPVFDPSLYHPQFPIRLICRLATLLIYLKLILYHHSQILFTFVHLKNSASQCQIRAIVVESKMYHRTLVDIECHLPILRPLEQYSIVISAVYVIHKSARVGFWRPAR